MDPKQAFKLRYVKSLLENNFCEEDSLKKKKKKEKRNLILKSNISKQEINAPLLTKVEKFLDPYSIHRILGDMMFLDKLDFSEPYVSWDSIRNCFKKIKHINIYQKFNVATFEDYTTPLVSIGLLTDRLKSKGDSICFDLAEQITNLELQFKTMSIASSNPTSPSESPSDFMNSINETNEFQKTLKIYENEPFITYHYVRCPNYGMRMHRVGISNMMRRLTFNDDIQIFEEDIMLIPTNSYWEYNLNILQKMFVENKYASVHLNTCAGVILATCETFSFWIINEKKEERIVMLVFPKELQTKELKLIYQEILNENERKNIGGGSQHKSSKNKKIKNFADWERLLKIYFNPWVKEEYRRGDEYRCSYKLIKEDKEEGNPLN